MHEHEHPLQGRAEPLFAMSVQLFGLVASPPTPYQSTYLPFIYGSEKWNACGCGLWTIQSTAIEAQREADEATAFSPLPNLAVFEPSMLPAGAVLTRRTQMKLRITAGFGAANRRFDIDAGQTLELNADRVCVQWLAPVNFYVVNDFTPGVAPPTRGPGFVLDEWLGVSLARMENSVGSNEATLTTHVFVPASTQVTIDVPPFAREVTVYQDPTLGTAAVQWTMLYGNPATLGNVIPHGTIPFLAGARKTVDGIVLPDTTHIQTDAALADRFFTMRWTIRP